MSKVVRRLPGAALAASGLVAIALRWELAPLVGRVRRTSLPPCSAVLAEIPSVLTAPGFGAALADSGQRLAVGLFIALTVGVSLGAVMGRQRIVQCLVEPFVVVAFPIPKPRSCCSSSRGGAPAA